MKKILLLILLLTVIIPFTSQAEAASTASSSADQTLGQKLDEKINELKTKIASTVAQLNLVEKRGIIGTISDVTSNQVTVTDIEGNTRFIDVDEITKFSSLSANGSFGVSDLTKGTRVRVLGTYNKESGRILARFIDVTVDPVYLSGEVSDLDKKNIMLTMTSENKKQTKIDIQIVTKMVAYSKDQDQTTRLGFSKIQLGDRIIVIGYPEKQDPTFISAARLIDFTDLPKDPKINISPTPDLTPSVSPATSPTAVKKTSHPSR